MRKYGEGIHHIIKKGGFWCVGRMIRLDADGTPIYQIVSNLYCYRGWAQAFARRRKLSVSNY